MEEKVDYIAPDFDIDNTETPLQEVPKEEATVKVLRRHKESRGI